MPAAKRRAQLVETAFHVFGREGYRQTSMNQIAAEAGVTKPVLYQHFASKRELFAELLSQVANELTETLGETLSGSAEPQALIDDGFRAYFDYFAKRPEAYAILFGDGVMSDEGFARERARFEATMADSIAALIDIDDLDPEGRLLLAHGIVGLAEGTLRHWRKRDPAADAGTTSATVAGFAWVGLRGNRRSL